MSPYMGGAPESWVRGSLTGIRKKLKWEAQLICNIKIDRMIGSSNYSGDK